MVDRWFRVPTSTIDGADGPKYRDMDGVTGCSGNTVGQSPQWIVRFYGDLVTLDVIASKNDTTQLTDSESAQKFDSASVSHLPDGGWDATSVNERFGVS